MLRTTVRMSGIAVVGGLTLLLSSVSWAGFGGSPGDASLSCFVDKSIPNKQTVKFKGSMAVDVTGNVGSGGDQDVDVIVRLQEKNTPVTFFRLHLLTPFALLSNNGRACRVFNPQDTNDPAVAAAVEAFLQQIRLAYSLPANSIFRFVGNFVNGEWETGQAIYNDESVNAIQSIPGTDHAGSMADFTVYAVY